MSSLYIHVPFCLRKCKYCDFISFENCDICIKSAYVNAVIREINGLPKSTFETVFIGGGTPTVLEAEQIEKILEAVLIRHSLPYNCEITVEANPETITDEYAKILYHAGINRVSMGLQSANDEVLKAIGRVHSYDRFLKAYDSLRAAGFENINVDLMYGLPKQSKEDFGNTINQVLSLNPEHISAYSLIVSEGTAIYKEVNNGCISLSDSEDMEEELLLIEKKYRKYEVSNYTLGGKRCKHNINYWDNGYYFGVGCGAHGCVNPRQAKEMGIVTKENIVAVRTEHTSVLKDYINGDNMSCDFIAKKESMFETVMLGLRMVQGISEDRFNKRYGVDLYSVIGKYIDASPLLIVRDKGYIYLTRRGVDIQNTVLVNLMEYF